MESLKSDPTLPFRGFIRHLLDVRVSIGFVFVLSVLSGVIVWGLTFYSFKVVVGEVRIIGVGGGAYWDSNCDNPVGSLSWGKIVINPLRPEVSKNITIYVRNEGSNPAVIRLNASNWSPSAVGKYMRLNWDYCGRVLSANEAVRVTLVLSVDSKIWFESPRIQDFSFDIIISAISV